MTVQLYSYRAQYLRDKPSTDRVAETILKFEEDFFRESRPKGRRRAEVTFCEPIPVMDFLAAYDEDAKGTCRDVTARLENAIRAVLE
jgi:hypothetical protein